MAGFNGAGTFVRTYNWTSDAANAIPIMASRFDTEDNGFASGLSNCICKDGQTTITADIPLNGHKLTGIGNATAGGDALNQTTGDARYAAISNAAHYNDATANFTGSLQHNGNAVAAYADTTANFTGDLQHGGISIPNIIPKTKASDTSMTNTTTLADDPDLVINSLAIGTYKIELFVNCAVSGGTPGFNCGFATSATMTAAYSQSDICVGGTVTSSARTLIGTVSLGTGVTTSAISNYVHWTGTVIVTVSGNLRFQWAQAGLDAVNSSIAKAGSWLIATKVT